MWIDLINHVSLTKAEIFQRRRGDRRCFNFYWRFLGPFDFCSFIQFSSAQNVVQINLGSFSFDKRNSRASKMDNGSDDERWEDFFGEFMFQCSNSSNAWFMVRCSDRLAFLENIFPTWCTNGSVFSHMQLSDRFRSTFAMTQNRFTSSSPLLLFFLAEFTSLESVFYWYQSDHVCCCSFVSLH
jgi:hypothetical protein